MALKGKQLSYSIWYGLGSGVEFAPQETATFNWKFLKGFILCSTHIKGYFCTKNHTKPNKLGCVKVSVRVITFHKNRWDLGSHTPIWHTTRLRRHGEKIPAKRRRKYFCKHRTIHHLMAKHRTVTCSENSGGKKKFKLVPMLVLPEF